MILILIHFVILVFVIIFVVVFFHVSIVIAIFIAISILVFTLGVSRLGFDNLRRRRSRSRCRRTGTVGTEAAGRARRGCEVSKSGEVGGGSHPVTMTKRFFKNGVTMVLHMPRMAMAVSLSSTSELLYRRGIKKKLESFFSVTALIRRIRRRALSTYLGGSSHSVRSRSQAQFFDLIENRIRRASADAVAVLRSARSSVVSQAMDNSQENEVGRTDGVFESWEARWMW